MSLEWARAHAIQNELRLRGLVESADDAGWIELTIMTPWIATIWLEGGARSDANALLRRLFAAEQSNRSCSPTIGAVDRCGIR